MRESPTILVVDDDAQAQRLLTRMLERDGYEHVRTAGSAARAREILGGEPVALMLTDLNMPGSSGIELVRHAACEHPETAAMMVSGDATSSVAQLAIEYGAYGFLTKPIRRTDLVVAVSNALRRRHLEMAHRAERENLEHVVAARTAALRASREETISRLARAVESRDPDTGSHIERMSQLCGALAARCGLDPESMRVASLLHDVGKIAIADSILQKPGPLTDDERAAMQEHARIGYEILSGSESDLLNLAAKTALTHHERWDGTGYPRGLAGTEIPIEGRIAAIADVFDALTSDRCYRPAYGFEDAMGIMCARRGSHFDPDLLDLFMEVLRSSGEPADYTPAP